MYEYIEETDCSGFLIREATDKTAPVNIAIHLENGLSGEDFLDELEDIENSNSKLVVIDSGDICSFLTREDKAHFGRVFFGETGRWYCTADDLSWLKRLKPRKICLSIAGNITLNHVADIIKLFQVMLPKNEYCIFSFEENDTSLIKVDVLAV